ncbi:response regulator transcription factor [Mucilaginibacter sp.]|uniref:response regulator transcription factor n=1 Tax=Mucilaginibacter sp. TaxID=1882438 RepID=UPI002605BA5E|nr:helix-turn-helix transcriptional regulator [Mucilaginibacter sp.]MDB4920773.1 LuxR family transcriptional regulator [Mucilaginibacter sp.]
MIRILPAGLLPSDTRIEFFNDPTDQEKSYFITKGVAARVKDAAENIKNIIRKDIAKHAVKAEALVYLGYETDNEQLEKYTSCCSGAFDGKADVVNGEFLHNEWWPCPKRGGECPVEGRLCDALVVGPNGDYLTASEIKVFTLAARGLQNKEIAYTLGISEETVKVHLKHIYAKSGVMNKSELILLAFKKNLI